MKINTDPDERECLDRHNPDHTCAGPVTGQPSHAGTGTMIYRCEAGHDVADERARKIRERYPDSPTAPGWFDPTYAGESWDES